MSKHLLLAMYKLVYFAKEDKKLKNKKSINITIDRKKYDIKRTLILII